jgi:tetratricopeptide (TPR) repeat protein
MKTLGADHPDTLGTLNSLAVVYRKAGQLPRAIELLEQVRNPVVKTLGAGHLQTLATLHNLALAYQDAGKWEQALPLHRQAAEGHEKRSFQHAHAGPTIAHLVACLDHLQEYTEAETWRRKWLAVVKDRTGPESPNYADELAMLGLNLLKQKKWADAEPVLRECLALREKIRPDAWTTFNTQSMLGEAYAGQKKYSEAEPLLLAGYKGMKKRKLLIAQPWRTIRLTEALERLVQLYEATDRKDEAANWRKELEAAKTTPQPTARP